MKYLIVIFLCFVGSCTSNTNVKSKESNGVFQKKSTAKKDPYIKICDTVKYEASINYQLKLFNATHLDLEDCLSDSMNQFLLSLDTNCLRNTPNYKKFICGILIKLYYHHVDCCKQSYDLFSMKIGGAKIIINEFQRIINVKQDDFNMLNSGTVFYFIETDSFLKKDPLLEYWVKKIKRNKNYVASIPKNAFIEFVFDRSNFSFGWSKKSLYKSAVQNPEIKKVGGMMPTLS